MSYLLSEQEVIESFTHQGITAVCISSPHNNGDVILCVVVGDNLKYVVLVQQEDDQSVAVSKAVSAACDNKYLLNGVTGVNRADLEKLLSNWRTKLAQ